ncbi:MAG: glutathione S-transferase family protein, partial [Gammaproteobacteria bacterium]
MKVYHFPPSPNSRRVLAVIYHLGLEAELELVDLPKGEQMREAFLRLNPNHMIPVLEDGDFVLWESNAIMQYLTSKRPGNALWPSDPKVQANISRWQCWQLGHWGAACGILIYERLVKKMFDLGPPDPAEIAKAEERFHRFADVLNRYLEGRTWLVGDSVTLADFSVGSLLDLTDAAKYPIEP